MGFHTVIKCFGFKETKKRMNKEIAKWLPQKRVLIRQLFVSTVSYFTLPFFYKAENATKIFFEKNYYIKPDGLVFDGNNLEFYSKISKTCNLGNLYNKNILDLGCGLCSLYNWLRSSNVDFKQYIGIDFAIRGGALSSQDFCVSDNVNNLDKYFIGQKKIIFLTNVVCYLNNKQFVDILRKCNPEDELIIVEPSPSIFWDAHFNNIKPVYRKVGIIKDTLVEEHFDVLGSTQDYVLKLGQHYIFPLSYCLHAKKK